MVLPNNINLRKLFAGAIGKAKLTYGPFQSKNTGKAQEPKTSASALLHPELSYARTFSAVASVQRARIPWGWLVMSMLGIVGSTYTDIIGFRVIFSGSHAAATMMACALEAFVVGTGIMLTHSNRRARRWIAGQAALFGATSVIFSVAGMSSGTNQVQASINAPIIALEAAHKGEKDEAEAAAQTELAALARIQNELHYINKHAHRNGSLDSPESGYAQDMTARRADLLDLRAKWRGFDFSADLAAAKSADQIWAALQHKYAELADLTAETSKLTAQRLDKAAKIPMPPYPAAPVIGAEDVRSGANDPTGMAALLHPTPKTLLFLLVALVLDGGPYLIAVSSGASSRRDETSVEEGNDPDDRPAGPEPEDDTEPLSLHEDLDERKRRVRRVGDDMQTYPLGDACESDIQAEIADFRSVECGAISNLKLMRAFEIFEEEVAIVRDAAARIGIGPEAVREHLDDAFRRLQERRRREQQIQDKEHALRHEKRELEQKLQGAADRLAIVKQIAGIQAELNSMSGTNH